MTTQASGDHLLSAAQRVWSEVSPEIKVSNEIVDGSLLPAEDLKKVVKWLQHSITKFGASAAVAEGEDRDKALKPIAEEVIKAFTAAAGTLLSLRKGAGESLIRELQENGSGLADAIGGLGASVGKQSMAASAGKALERVKFFERTSTQNRAAVRRRLLKSVAQLRDASKEMTEELRVEEGGGGGAGGYPSAEAESEDEDEEFSEFQEAPLEPSERRVVEAILKAASLLEEQLKEASSSTLPKTSSSESSLPGPSLEQLEAAAVHAEMGTGAIDALAADAVGGIDFEACKKGMSKLQEALGALGAQFSAVASDDLQSAFDAIKEALDAAQSEEGAQAES